ncbi:MBL fold metallo-hydrolase RNA specificity domain-containing protein [Granulosicoccus antarcticus]|uniref:Ribonuclease n=1 Tax=Granulosicoccus antarcticus IMCC3135 TaxID=1192854 RepID=A0A2Z2NV95_9GAMM|nr:MBL fold metallo-hydrolase [Granulosicoccus antarcticus]ASJ75462.1 Ribonuclease [Granulosicoccus antarcticus IMCC3135]
MKLTSYGAAEEVTGSCHLIETSNHKVLFDCGLIQGRRKDELRNHDPFPFNPAELDAVVLSHAHIDHCGRLPMLIDQGFTGKIHCHDATADLVQILLKDSANLNARDVEYRNRKRKRAGKPLLTPLYNQEDVENTLDKLAPMQYLTSVKVAPGVSIKLYDAGHILGSAMVEITLVEDDETRTVVFSGDLGHRGSPILRDFSCLQKADLVLMESTYGNRLHRDWSETVKEVQEIASALSSTRGNILIPAFSVGRSQMILYTMARYFKEWDLERWKIFLDSPMAIRACEVYLKHTALYDEQAAAFYKKNGPLLSMPNLTFSQTADQSRAINAMQTGAIVIAGSGMCTGGRIIHHLKHNLWRADAHVIIAGYQAHGTLGRKLVDGKKTVKIWGEKIVVRATIHTVGGLSAHADQQGMMDWYASFEDTPPVLLVHGEVKAMQVLADRLTSELGARARAAQPGKSTDLLALDKFGR